VAANAMKALYNMYPDRYVLYSSIQEVQQEMERQQQQLQISQSLKHASDHHIQDHSKQLIKSPNRKEVGNGRASFQSPIRPTSRPTGSGSGSNSPSSSLSDDDKKGHDDQRCLLDLKSLDLEAGDNDQEDENLYNAWLNQTTNPTSTAAAISSRSQCSDSSSSNNTISCTSTVIVDKRIDQKFQQECLSREMRKVFRDCHDPSILDMMLLVEPHAGRLLQYRRQDITLLHPKLLATCCTVNLNVSFSARESNSDAKRQLDLMLKSFEIMTKVAVYNAFIVCSNDAKAGWAQLPGAHNVSYLAFFYKHHKSNK
jgi:hypothetical protein